MPAKITSLTKSSVTLEIRIDFSNSMLETEDNIQKTLNEAGVLATGEALKSFDTNGAAINFGSVKMTSKGLAPKEYQTPYGAVSIDRHVYQASIGGKTYCPLESNARIVVTSTPKFAQQVSHKFAEMASPQVQKDLEINHGRHVTRCYLQDVVEAVGAIAIAQEESWEYDVPKQDKVVRTISIGLDGTCMLLCQEGYRQAMVGTLTLYDKDGERLHTTYIASSPEYGKEEFKRKLEREIELVKKHYPKAICIGLADGAKDNWEFLASKIDYEILDFWHVTEYLAAVAEEWWPKTKDADIRKEWLDDRCHRLKHEKNMVNKLIKELENEKAEPTSETATTLKYLNNNKKRMDYASHVISNHPIGSGITEAACKIIVKQRLCKSGMKWKDKGAKIVLSLRALTYSSTRWEQFWNKINHCGFQREILH